MVCDPAGGCPNLPAYQRTTGTTQPMRNFLLRGPAGTGKTESAKAIAAGLQLPIPILPVRPTREIFDFLGQILPDIEGMPSQKIHPHCQLPTLEDIQMDPASAYYSLTGGNTGIPLPSRKYTTSCWKRWKRKPEKTTVGKRIQPGRNSGMWILLW